jgi:hypothetical protein
MGKNNRQTLNFAFLTPLAMPIRDATLRARDP